MIAFDIFIQQAGAALTAVLLFFVHVIIARLYGPLLFGEYAYILSICSIYAIVMDGGFKTLIFRQSVDRDRPAKLFKQAMVHLIWTLPGGVVLLMGLRITPVHAFLAASYFMLFVFSNFLFFYFKGRGQFLLDAVAKTALHCLILLILCVSLLLGIKTVSSVFIIFIAAYLLWFFLLFKAKPDLDRLFEWMKGIKARWKTEIKLDLTIYKSCLVFTAIDLFTLIYFRIDTVMIRYFYDITAVAQYNAAYKIIEAVIFLTVPASHVFFQRVRQNLLDEPDSKKIFNRCMLLASIAALLASLFIAFLSDIIIPLIYGSQYVEASILLKILAWSILFIIPNAFLTQMCIAANHEKFYMAATIAAAFFNIILNLILLPIMQSQGAAVATIFTEGILFVSLLFLIMKGNFYDIPKKHHSS